MIFSFVFDRVNRGLLEEAFAPKEAAASFTTGTAEEECLAQALAAIEPIEGALWPKEGRRGVWLGWRKT